MVPLLPLYWPDPLQKKDLKWCPKGQTLRRSDEVGVAEAYIFFLASSNGQLHNWFPSIYPAGH